MYPYGASRSFTPDNLGRRPAKCPSLLRLNSVGEITSDESITHFVQSPQKNTSSMGMSLLLNKNNILGRQSLCANKRNNYSTTTQMGEIDDVNNRAFTVTTPYNSAPYSSPAKMDVPFLSVLASMPDRERANQMHMNKQCFQFHPFIKQTCASSFYENRPHPMNMDTTSKRFKSSLPTNCFRGFSGNKKKNRYNKYNWQPPPKVEKTSFQGSPPLIQVTKMPKKATSGQVDPPASKEQAAVAKTSAKVADNSGKEKCCDINITSQMEQLSLGEKVALEKAKDSALEEHVHEAESDMDWFSMTRQNSEKEFPSYVQNLQEDEESDDNLCNIISEEVRDLFTCSDQVAEDRKCDIADPGDIRVPESKDSPSPEKNVRIENKSESSKVNDEKSAHGLQENSASEKCLNRESENILKIPMVLFVRNNKKCRTSRKNRRKSGKNIPSDDSTKRTCTSSLSDADNGKKRKFNIFSETYPPTSASASHFNVHSFLVSFNEDENTDSDWSDEDDDEDEDDIKDDKGCEADLMSFANFACPLNLNVICQMATPESPKSSANEELDAVNAAWKINIQLSPNPRKPKNCDKKVHFAEDDVLTVTHAAENWCRKGPWEEFARDRERFTRRICDAECVIGPVLKPDHRQKIRNYISQFNTFD